MELARVEYSWLAARLLRRVLLRYFRVYFDRFYLLLFLVSL